MDETQRSRLFERDGPHGDGHDDPSADGCDCQIHGQYWRHVAGQVAFYRFFFQLVATVPVLWFTMGLSGFKARSPLQHAARGAAWRASLPFLHLGQIHAAGRCLRHLFRRADDADGAVGPLSRRAGGLAAVAGHCGRLCRRHGRHPALLGDFRADLAAAARLRLSLLVYMFSTAPSATATSRSPCRSIPASAARFSPTASCWWQAGSRALESFPLAALVLVRIRPVVRARHDERLRPISWSSAPSGWHRLSVLAPFQYFEIISATILGLVFFGDFLDMTKWIGIAIIIASGLYIIWSELGPPEERPGCWPGN